MALISKWFKHMCTVPPRVYFVAAVFALSTVYVSQEAGLAFAKSEENFRQPPPMMGEGKFQRPPNDNQEGKFKSPEDNKMRLEGQQNQALQMPEGDDRKNGGENMPAFSDEEFDKRQAQMEAQRAEQMKKQFAQMKTQFGQMGKMLSKVEARIAVLEKQGVKAPADVIEALTNAKSSLALVQNATSLDDAGVQDAMDTLRESGQTLGEGMQNLERLSQMPKMLKQAASEIKKLETSYAKSQKSATRLKVDVSAQLAEFRKAIDVMKAGYTSAEQLTQSGDAEGASDTLKSEVWENMQDAQQYPGMIEALGNVRKYITNFDKFVVKAAKNKSVLADSEATDALAEMRTKVVELKQLASQPSDPEELRSAVEDIFDLQSTVQNAMGSVQQNNQVTSGNSNFDFSSFGQTSGL
jgi:hypothetical protein